MDTTLLSAEAALAFADLADGLVQHISEAGPWSTLATEFGARLRGLSEGSDGILAIPRAELDQGVLRLQGR